MYFSVDDDIEALKAIQARLRYLLNERGGRGVNLAEAIDSIGAAIDALEGGI